jgi:hypothetical protein
VPHGSELNQVWTNIVGNATDAIGGRGTNEHQPQHWPGQGAGSAAEFGRHETIAVAAGRFAGHLRPANPVTGSAGTAGTDR